MNSSRVHYFKLAVLAWLLAGTVTLSAQRVAPLLRKGKEAVENTDYYTAIHYYQQALAIRPAATTRYALAEAARAFQAYDMAVEHYEALGQTAAGQQFPLLDLGLGLSYQSRGEYAEALGALQRYISSGKGTAIQRQTAETAILGCQWALEQPDSSHWQITRLPRRINSPYGEFGAYRAGDTLYYSSYRFEKEDDDYRPVRKVSKVLYSKDDRRGRTLRRDFNVDTAHTAHTTISTNGQQLYFTRCQFTSAAEISCKLCVRKKDRRRRWSTKYEVLPSPVNLSNFTATQPAIRWDSTDQQEYLLFVSDRPGGVGGFDIWEVPIPKGRDKWVEPKPLTNVNTTANEVTPFYEAEERMLYFASDRQPGFGGYDLWKQELTEEPIKGDASNLGIDVNSSYDDTYPFWTADEERVYFSSNRPGATYLDRLAKTCCPDIFRAKNVPPIESVPIDSTDTAPTPPLANTTTILPPPPPVMPTTLEEFLPLTLFFDNDRPDPRTRTSTTRLDYGETYFDYIDRETDYYTAWDEENEGEQEEISGFFEEEVELGFEHLERFSEILLQQLELDRQPQIEIFLKGYTSPRAKGDYNKLLGKRRVSAVRNHFERWRGGILQQFIKRGQLIISEVSFGETRASAGVQDERGGERNSVYSAAAARERRVEIVEIKQQ